MLAKVHSGAIVGLDAVPVEVEADISHKNFGKFTIVGLGDKAIEEARERVRSAILNSKLEFPKYYITVNLAPADLKKEGPAYDLPIALSVLISDGKIPFSKTLEKSLAVGELSLDGSLRPTAGVLPFTLLAKNQGLEKIFLPAPNAKEASVVEGIEVIPVTSLEQLFAHLTKGEPLPPHPHTPILELTERNEDFEFDFADIKGQEQVKRALEIAAAGGHNVSLTGPPGAGKTLLARSLPSILPSLTTDEALEVTKIYSILGLLSNEKPLISQRPFRAPHHTTSRIGLIGGGSKIQPGEISLAHRGVLFLDEFPELPRSVLESLRQPMEDGFVQISRAQGSLTLPAKFILIAASNPCPCGFLGSEKRKCSCSLSLIQKYKKRISGPILDRIDLHIEVPAVEVEKLMVSREEKNNQPGRLESSSEAIAKRVQQARDLQLARYQDLSLKCNAELSAKHIETFCPLKSEGKTLLHQAMLQLALSARVYHKILKVARTIADLAESERIETQHLAESLQFIRREI